LRPIGKAKASSPSFVTHPSTYDATEAPEYVAPSPKVIVPDLTFPLIKFACPLIVHPPNIPIPLNVTSPLNVRGCKETPSNSAPPM
jgi:hypothetical protein